MISFNIKRNVSYFQMPIVYFLNVYHVIKHYHFLTAMSYYPRLNFLQIVQDYCLVLRIRFPLNMKKFENSSIRISIYLPSKLDSLLISSPISHVSSNACRTLRFVSPSNSAVSIKQSPFGSLVEIKTMSAYKNSFIRSSIVPIQNSYCNKFIIR